MKTIRDYLTQERQIIEHFHHEKSLSGIEALHLYRVKDLPKRISVLRKQGYRIHGEWRRDTKGSRYMRYWLEAKTPKEVEDA